MHRGRKCVVGGLRHVDVIVGVDWLLTAHHAAGDFDGAVADDFVDVHVGLGAAAGLPDTEREVIVELPTNYFVGRLRDEFGFFWRELAEILIDQRGSFFQDAERADQFGRHGLFADGEMDQRTGGLRAIVTVGGDVHFAHGIGFAAGRRGGAHGLYGIRHEHS